MIQIWNKIHKYRIAIILISIIAVGSFFRLYNAEKWMHYELDQVRDYKVIHTAIKHGITYLPLQGPRAAGSVIISETNKEYGYGGKTTLRLGPLFYYIEYLSAVIFGDTPFGSIVLIIILSILSIPIFYLLIREFFDKKISLGLTSILATSLFFISYSRFSWNPNLIPFFLFTSAYTLLQSAKFYGDNSNKGGLWLVLVGISFAFLSNMHFLAFIAFSVILVVFFVISRPKINIKFWIASIGIFIALNTPLIINDIKTGGENVNAFIASITKSSKNADKTIFEKFARESLVFSRYNFISVTGYQRAEVPKIKRGKIICDKNCKEGLIFGFFSLMMLFIGFVSTIYLYKKIKDIKKRNFLLLSIIWAICIFLLYLPLVYKFVGRFFLLFAPISIIYVGIILHTIKKLKYGNFIINIIILTLIISNIIFTSIYFFELKQSSTDIYFDNRRDYILGEKTRITYAQINEIFDYMISIQQKNNFPIFLHGQSEFERVFRKFNYEENVLKRIPKDLNSLYRYANYFFIIRTQSDFEEVFKNYMKAFDIIEKKTFGTLTIYNVKPIEMFITGEKVEFTKFKYSDPVFSKSRQVRYLWHQIFSGCRYKYSTKKCEK